MNKLFPYIIDNYFRCLQWKRTPPLSGSIERIDPALDAISLSKRCITWNNRRRNGMEWRTDYGSKVKRCCCSQTYLAMLYLNGRKERMVRSIPRSIRLYRHGETRRATNGIEWAVTRLRSGKTGTIASMETEWWQEWMHHRIASKPVCCDLLSFHDEKRIQRVPNELVYNKKGELFFQRSNLMDWKIDTIRFQRERNSMISRCAIRWAERCEIYPYRFNLLRKCRYCFKHVNKHYRIL